MMAFVYSLIGEKLYKYNTELECYDFQHVFEANVKSIIFF